MTAFPEAKAVSIWDRYKAVARKFSAADDLPTDDDSEPGEAGEGGDDEDGAAVRRRAPESDGSDDSVDDMTAPEREVVQDRVGSSDASDPNEVYGPTPILDARIGGFDEGLASRISDEVVQISASSDYIIFTRDFDKIAPYEVSHDYRDWMLHKMEESTSALTGVMQKDIERMMAARSQVVRVGGFKSGRLKGSALHRLRTNDDRVFDRKQENRSKDIAVELLVDCSGSMSGGGKIMTAMSAAFALSSVLERVQIKHEVMGFTTGNSNSVQENEIAAGQRKLGRRFSRIEPLWMPIFKGEHERLSSDVKKRFADVPHNMHTANNVDGECVEIAATRLKARKAGRHVLIVLSDGQPSAAGTRSDLGPHLKKTVKECGKMGVECIGIGINDDSVRRYYPKFLVLHNVQELPAAVMGELKLLLT